MGLGGVGWRWLAAQGAKVAAGGSSAVSPGVGVSVQALVRVN